MVWMNPYIFGWKRPLCMSSFDRFYWSMGLGRPGYKASLWHIPICECVMDRSEIPQGQNQNQVLVWTGISQDPGHRSSEAIWCTCDVLPQLAAISQLGDSIRGLKGPCSVVCVFSGSKRHHLAPSVFSLGRQSGLRVFYPFSFSPDSWLPLNLWFLGPNVFFSVILIESVGGCGFHPYCHFLDTKGPVCLLCLFPNLQPPSLRISVFWGNITNACVCILALCL